MLRFIIVLSLACLALTACGGGGGSGSSGGSGGSGGIVMALGRVVLPALTLALFFLAYIARLTRASVLDVLSADFVRTARAKGLSPWGVISHHVGANAGLPVLSYLGPAAANVLVGSFGVEKLYAIPGLGTHFVNGCLNKDIPLVLGAVMVYSALVIVFNLLVDLAYAAVDPRITLR
jgi:oligopeptide transport system permease protein